MKKGFTLLEMLLVVLIIAIMATVTLQIYERYSVDARIKKTALQIQALLQASTAYFIDNNCWPLSASCGSNAPNFNSYITFSKNNPWGQLYSYQIEPNFGKKFQVRSGELPNNSIAQQVKNLLPTAIIDPNDDKQVLAEITVENQPAQIIPNAVISVMQNTPALADGSSYGSQSPGSPLTFSCPHGWKGNGIAIPMDIELGNPECSKVLGYRSFQDLNGFALCAPRNDVNNNFDCEIITSFQGFAFTKTDNCNDAVLQGSGSVSFSFIGWCQQS